MCQFFQSSHDDIEPLVARKGQDRMDPCEMKSAGWHDEATVIATPSGSLVPNITISELF
jgi:hypothetical protein